ncbi:MAG: hypothetical protein HKN04_10890 [Rhodothermaceae bacterium]|nr:hypothetical protein [Rhodothermaceae bacterium]
MLDDRYPSPALHAMALVASLRAAVGVSKAIAARRAGHDATMQEPEAPVRAYLGEALERIGSLTLRLRLRTVAGEPDDEQAALVQTFEDRLALADLTEELRVAHQKLLSLYPAVPEDLIEVIRVQHQKTLRLLDADDLDAHLGRFTEQLAADLDALRIALAVAPGPEPAQRR